MRNTVFSNFLVLGSALGACNTAAPAPTLGELAAGGQPTVRRSGEVRVAIDEAAIGRTGVTLAFPSWEVYQAALAEPLPIDVDAEQTLVVRGPDHELVAIRSRLDGALGQTTATICGRNAVRRFDRLSDGTPFAVLYDVDSRSVSKTDPMRLVVEMDINSNCDAFVGFDGDCDDDSDSDECKNKYTLTAGDYTGSWTQDGLCIEREVAGFNTCECNETAKKILSTSETIID